MNLADIPVLLIRMESAKRAPTHLASKFCLLFAVRISTIGHIPHTLSVTILEWKRNRVDAELLHPVGIYFSSDISKRPGCGRF